MTGIPRIAAGFSTWKIFTGVAALVAIVIAGFLLKTTMENRSLTKQRDALSKSINDPETGYIVRLDRARINVTVLRTAIEKQNKAFTAQSQAASKELERLRAELNRAEAEKRRAQADAAKFLATKPRGDTLEKRVKDVDDRILEDLKQ